MTPLEKAIQLREAGQLEKAQSLLLELVKQEPSNPSVWYQCAWIHDVLGLEKEAVPFYEKALELGLADDEKQGTLLGLGSTYRTLGMYDQAQSLFEKAIEEFPDRNEYRVFYAMVLYNQQNFSEAMSILLTQLAETSKDPGIQNYKKAITFYSENLDRVWN